MDKSTHEWSKEAFFAKAQLYAEAMSEHEASSWQFGLWSAFTLEMLVRGAVAIHSPALVADTQDWNNVLYGLGTAPKKRKFLPRSASITELIGRAEELCPNFSSEQANFCASHFSRRNSEVHTGTLAFENLGSSTWLPAFYSACEILVLGVGESLEALFGKELSVQAREDIAAFKDETAKSVKGTIEAHSIVWAQKVDGDKLAAKSQAEATMLRHEGHRVSCPACKSIALLQGKTAGPPRSKVEDSEVVERRVVKPETFHCIACGLKIHGYSKLLVAGLGDVFTSTSRYEPMEYFGIDLDAHARSMFEDDNNEY